MPEIKEKNLLELYSELDKLEVEKKELQNGFIKLKLKLNKKIRQYKDGKIIFILSLVVLVLLALSLYINHTNSKEKIQKFKNKEIVLLDSIHKLSVLIPKKVEAEVVYSVQLGVYKKLNLKLNPGKNTNVKEITEDDTKTYLIGSFLKYNAARNFKNKLKKIGLKDAFLVPYNKNHERIDIKEALVLSNEESFIRD